MPGTRDSASSRAKTPATASAPTASHAQPASSLFNAPAAGAEASSRRIGEEGNCAAPLIASARGSRIEMDRHHVDDETGHRDEQPQWKRHPGETTVRRETLLDRVEERQGHKDGDHEGQKDVDGEEGEVDRTNGAIPAEFRQPRRGVIDRDRRRGTRRRARSRPSSFVGARRDPAPGCGYRRRAAPRSSRR